MQWGRVGFWPPMQEAKNWYPLMCVFSCKIFKMVDPKIWIHLKNIDNFNFSQQDVPNGKSIIIFFV